MDLELLLQASCSDSGQPNIASQPSESLDDSVCGPERSDGCANVTAMPVWIQHDRESQSVDGKAEAFGNVSENAYLTPNMPDSADIEPIFGVLPESLSAVEVTQEVCATILTKEDRFPSSPVVPTDGLVDTYDLDIPSSSPPASSPLTSGYFRSSSPIPTASSSCGYDLTPPTSPVKISTEHAKIPIDKFQEVEPLEFISDQSETDISGHDENTATVIGSTNHSMSSEDCLPEISENKDDAHPTDHGIVPREKVYQRLIPGPKRATLAAQKVRQQKLSKPFRPPTVQKPIAHINPGNAHPVTAPGQNDTDYKPAVRTSSFAQKMQEKMKNQTAKAAAQFKSPLVSSSAGGEEGPLVRPTPTIQALERKLQLLKRAVKVKENSEEEILSGLIQKWTEAGRDIAWEVWGLAKDVGNEAGRKRQMEDSWGWQDGDSKRQKAEERLWGWDVIPVTEREQEPRRTLGTMLVEMGVAPETFGWNADEERFEDRLL